MGTLSRRSRRLLQLARANPRRCEQRLQPMRTRLAPHSPPSLVWLAAAAAAAAGAAVVAAVADAGAVRR